MVDESLKKEKVVLTNEEMYVYHFGSLFLVKTAFRVGRHEEDKLCFNSISEVMLIWRSTGWRCERK